MNGRVERRVGELLAHHGLSLEVGERLISILSTLADERQAPTSVRDPAQAVEVHIADALTALELDQVRSARRIVDIGAGAGVPGLPLAAALPLATVALLESQSRKCAFIERARIRAGISNARAVGMRAEQWQTGAGAHDLALARAIAPASIVLEYAAPLLEVGGLLVDWRGRRNPDEERRAAEAANELGLVGHEVRRVAPFPLAAEHHLHVYRKAAPTPDRFPRRPGVARKRPLGRANAARTVSEPAADRDQR